MYNNPFLLKGKTALITGGATGIGFGIAETFVKAGAKVIIIGRREKLLADAVAHLGENAFYRRFDLDALNEIPALIRGLEEEYGNIDILVNNAGVHAKKYVVDTTDDEFYSILKTNLISVFAITRECAKFMLARKSGSVILISSMTAGVAMKEVVGYSTAKTALLGMMRTMSVEFSESNVRINAIAPGWIASDMLRSAVERDPERKAKILGRIPGKNFGSPVDIGNAAVFLASDASSYINNVLLPVDGGAFQAL